MRMSVSRQVVQANYQRSTENRQQGQREKCGDHFRNVTAVQVRLNNSHLMQFLSPQRTPTERGRYGCHPITQQGSTKVINPNKILVINDMGGRVEDLVVLP